MKKKIFIVDDTADTVELLKKRFSAEGYDTCEAYDGEECLEKVKEYLPDIILLDVMMPKLNGFEACRRLKADDDTKYIPVLMLTAKSEVPDKVKGLDIGADDYITKPFDYKELSARVRSLLAKKAASEKLAETEKTEALGHMMDELAHEIRNPLVSIGGFARRVYEELPEGSPNRKYIEIILQDVERLEKMIKRLIEVKSASLSYIEPADINDIIAKSVEKFEQDIEEKDINVEISLTENPPLVRVDRENLKKAISNIIENAIESMKSGTKTLRISTKTSGGVFEIQISDTGRGIPRDKIKSIYDPFVTSKIYGPGLGLTVALNIIQNHKGTILVESKEGEGTTFTIRLPMRSSLHAGKPQQPL